MTIESTLKYNNSRYGRGTAYVAKITGKDKKWGFKREFLPRDVEYKNSSKTTWYSYSWNITEEGIYEKKESNAFKTKIEYFIYKNGEIKEISKSEVKELLEEMK